MRRIGSLARGMALLATVAIAVAAGRADAQFDMSIEQKLLLDLLRDGKYRQALSEAKRIEKVVKPAKKNAVIGPATRIYVDLLVYQGTIERRMGNLDAADKMLTEAFNIWRDPAYQQLLARSMPADEAEQQTYLLSIELPYLQLLDNGIEVLLERIHTANQRLQLQASKPAEQEPAAAPAAAAATADEAEADADAADDRDQIVVWFRRLDDLIRMSQAARSSLRGQFQEPGKPGDVSEAAQLANSPQARMMTSMSRPYRFVGMRYLEASRLPWTLSFDTDTPPEEIPSRKNVKPSASEPTDETADERARQAASQRLRATAYLQRSVDIAEAAMAPVLEAVGRDEAGDTTVKKAIQEAARVRAERLLPQAEVALLDDDLDTARSRIDAALSGLREAEPPRHPELARPLITSAEVSFAESRRSLADKDAVAARDQAERAVEALREAQQLLTAKDSAFDPEAPLHVLLASQLAVAESFAKSSSQTAAASSAADAAARRAMAAMKPAPKPKPVTPAPAPDPKAGGKPAGAAAPPPPAAGNKR